MTRKNKRSGNQPVIMELLVRKENNLLDFRRISCLRKNVPAIRYKIMIKDGEIIGCQILEAEEKKPTIRDSGNKKRSMLLEECGL
ncbi:hypothetical protein AAFX24_17415 [Vibrio mediterranei]|uniref:hypothetical protein n=1 Tax=Vibrio mediterranei TaxID=689 RepID=UPI0038CF0206